MTRKGKEIVISIKIAKQKSKDQILEDYLNTIYYGRGAYGVQTASKAYFNKDVSKLTVSEGALLASVIRGPSFYDPGLGAEQTQNAKDRWTYVMDGMVVAGLPERRRARQGEVPEGGQVHPGARAPAGRTASSPTRSRRELKSKLKLTDADIDRGGYKIVTTVDKKAQDAAIAAVKERMPTGKGTDTLRVGLTSIKPGDGAVVAMYGGSDYRKEQFNTATQATMQAGSTFKIFTLLAALSQKDPISTKTKFDGRTPQYFKEFEDPGAATDFLKRGGVRNFGPFPGEQFGNIDLRTATGHSVNTVYAQLNIKVGPKATRDAAVAAGLPAKGLGTNYANVLGTSPVKVIDMANAYATIAAKGQRVTPYFIKTVEGGPGNLDYKAKPTKKAAFDADVMADVTDAMEEPIKDGTAQYAQNLGRPAAGKTGTTTDNKAAWFDGFTPQLATAVGIYSSGKDGEELSMNDVSGVGELTGATVPLRIWTDFMTAALKGQPVVDFPPRVGVGDDQDLHPAAAPALVVELDHHQLDHHDDDHDDDGSALDDHHRGAAIPDRDDEDHEACAAESHDPRDGHVARERHAEPHHRGAVTQRRDLLPSGSLAVAGGPLGRHASARATSWLATVLPLLVAVSATMALSVLERAHCIQKGWAGSDQFWHACFSDLPAQYQIGNLDQGLAAYVGGEGARADHPVLTGSAMAWLGGLVPDGAFLDQTRWYFALWALFGTVLALAIVGFTAASRPRNAALAVHVALSPVLLLAAMVSSDLFGVALVSAGIWAWSRRHPVAAGVLLGLAVTARTYPLLVLLALVLLGLRTGRLPAVGRTLVAAAGAVAVVLLPFLVGHPVGDPALDPGLVGQRRRSGFGVDAAPAPRCVAADLRDDARGPRGARRRAGRRRGLRPEHRASPDPRRGVPGPGRAGPAVRQGLSRAVLAVARPAGRPVRGALARPPLWAAAEALHFVAVWLYVAGLSTPDRGLPAGWYAAFLVLRVLAVGHLVWRVWRTAAVRPAEPLAEPTLRRAPRARGRDVRRPTLDAAPTPHTGSGAVPGSVPGSVYGSVVGVGTVGDGTDDVDEDIDELEGDFAGASDQFLVRLA